MKVERNLTVYRFGDAVAVHSSGALRTIYLTPEMAGSLAVALERLRTDIAACKFSLSIEATVEIDEEGGVR